MKISLPDSEISLHQNHFDAEIAGNLLRDLTEEIPWVQNKIRFYGKESLVPRLESWHGDEGMSYTYSGIRMDAKPWTKNLLIIKESIEPIAKTTFNSVLINYYRDGKDRVAWHSDDEKELGKNPVIASVSLGAERKFKLRHKKYKENQLQHEVFLQNGSLLLMSGSTQHNWLHEIPRTAKPIGPRINLTFRVIKN
ncbi:MAG: alpha-ketoglutarate-dependent dioxygenase AlkB [Verrucomicrobiota bacterium]|nr:alpha-ketoglutarate-dependent dioxygenase AlkB [Verrucomicrobiota bacterium]|tara:strand:+ start:293 stop:877 length:585 start_codon:yes stop_codon:yes gene_type:complete